ncbi:MAG: hypothetical protein NTV99_09100, partial [Deltaproteobacteria bacterium]|nr:hypothetical protein [Deltaproteobacteria bacterium]
MIDITLEDFFFEGRELAFFSHQVEFGESPAELICDVVVGIPGYKLGQFLLTLKIFENVVIVISIDATPLKILIHGDFVLLIKPV